MFLVLVFLIFFLLAKFLGWLGVVIFFVLGAAVLTDKS